MEVFDQGQTASAHPLEHFRGEVEPALFVHEQRPSASAEQLQRSVEGLLRQRRVREQLLHRQSAIAGLAKKPRDFCLVVCFYEWAQLLGGPPPMP